MKITSDEFERRFLLKALGAAGPLIAGTSIFSCLPASSAAEPSEEFGKAIELTPSQRAFTRTIYEGFAKNRLERWNDVVHEDVVMNSSGAWNVVGLEKVKTWARAFHESFHPKIDLVDEFMAGDRAWVTINMHWKHDGSDFFGVKPSGASGTSVEVFILRLRNGKAAYLNVADNTLDLARYLMDHGFQVPKNIDPPALVKA